MVIIILAAEILSLGLLSALLGWAFKTPAKKRRQTPDHKAKLKF